MEPIFDSDIVTYLVFDPLHYPSGIAGGIDLSSGLQFADEHGRKESVNCQRLFRPPYIDSHELGRVLEMRKNEEKTLRGKPPVSYQGFKTAIVEHIRNIQVGTSHFTIEHHEEDLNYAHCDLNLVITDSTKAKSIKSEARRLICDKFSNFVGKRT